MVNRKLMKDLEARTFESFGALSAFIRNRYQLSLRSLARTLGMNDSTASYLLQIEKGPNKEIQSPRIIARYAQEFGISLAYLIKIDTSDQRSRLENWIQARELKVREHLRKDPHKYPYWRYSCRNESS